VPPVAGVSKQMDFKLQAPRMTASPRIDLAEANAPAEPMQSMAGGSSRTKRIGSAS